MDNLKRMGKVVKVGELTVHSRGHEQQYSNRPVVFADGFLFVEDNNRVFAYAAAALVHAEHVEEWQP